MQRYLALVFFVFLVNVSISQELTATMNMPESVQPGEKFLVEVTIKKGAINSYIKFLQKLPKGYRATEKDIEGGNFSFVDSVVKIVWLFPPAKQEFTFSYSIKAPNDVDEYSKIGGKIYYFFNTNRESFSFDVKSLKVGNPSGPRPNYDVASSEKDTVYIDRVIVKETKVVDSTPKVVVKAEEVKVEMSSTLEEEKVVESKVADNNSASQKEEEQTTEKVTTETIDVKTAAVDVKPAMVSTPVSNTTIPKETEKLTETSTEVKSQQPSAPMQVKQESVVSKSADTKPVVKSTPALATGELVYGVQVGAYKEQVPLDVANKFFEVSAIGIKNLKKNDGVTTFIVGEFTTYDEGFNVKNEMIRKGFSDAFIVSYTKGSGGENSETVSVNNVSATSSETSPVKKSEPKQEEPVQEKKGIELNGTPANDIIRTVNTPNLNSEKEAEPVVVTPTPIPAKEKGTQQPVVDTKMPEGKPIETSVEDVPFDTTKTELIKTYRVQVGAYKDAVPADIAQKFIDVGAVGVKNLKGNTGVTYYIVGDFTNREDAEKHKELMIQKGFEGAFIIIYYKL